jgi:hypothetical protein
METARNEQMSGLTGFYQAERIHDVPGDAPDGPRQTVLVRSPSVLRETGGVVRAVAHILFWSAAIMGARWGMRSGATGAAASTTTAVDEVAFRELDPSDQRMYRRCLEGLTEAEDVRSKKGDWPSVDQLAARGIPPFAADPLDKANYRWQLLRDKTLVTYQGVPDAASKRPTIVIDIVEPDPGTPIDPQAVVDETHHKLADGTVLHVSVWTGTKTLTQAVSTPAFEDGWRRITMVAP